MENIDEIFDISTQVKNVSVLNKNHETMSETELPCTRRGF